VGASSPSAPANPRVVALTFELHADPTPLTVMLDSVPRRYPPPKPSRWRGVAPGGQGTVRTGGRPGWAELRRQTFERDGHQCTFVSRAGVRCTTTQILQVHHLKSGTEQIVPLEQLTVRRLDRPAGRAA
jgi:hypothetical protein